MTNVKFLIKKTSFRTIKVYWNDLVKRKHDSERSMQIVILFKLGILSHIMWMFSFQG